MFQKHNDVEKKMTSSYYSIEELKEIGFANIGHNVMISRKASIYGADKISIGNNVRIDDFCLLSGRIQLGDYIHIAVYSALFGGSEGIEMKNFTTVSSRCALYAVSDDYSGEAMTYPMAPDCFLRRINKKIILNKHVLIGTGSTVLPGVEIGEGTAVGAMSLVNKSLGEWGIYAGIPCSRLKERSKYLLELEQKFYES